ncbi:MAG: hypothetical protein IJ362_07405 [Oscillospiraceae bacterium]|nr:hypothetical protein [Oscillospiraceae bacterium]
MIIDLIKKILSFVTDTIFSVIDLPVVPDGLVSAVNMVLGYMQQGMGIINFFCPLSAISPAIDLFIAVWTVEHSYRLVMWVLQKIPMLNIQ